MDYAREKKFGRTGKCGSCGKVCSCELRVAALFWFPWGILWPLHLYTFPYSDILPFFLFSILPVLHRLSFFFYNYSLHSFVFIFLRTLSLPCSFAFIGIPWVPKQHTYQYTDN